MEIDALVCDHAEVADGKLFINGAGITVSWVAPQAPHVIAVSLGAVIQVPYTATNEPHILTVELIDEDHNVVAPWVPEGVEAPGPVRVETSFNVGRPPGLPVGETQLVPITFGFPGLALGRLGLYLFAISIDGNERKRLPLRLAVPPQVPPAQAGPASIRGIG